MNIHNEGKESIMNNYELHDQATVLADTTSAYQLAKRVLVIEAEHDALAAHVERIKTFWVLIDRGVSIPSQRWKLDELIEGAPATNLDRLKAQWQAEALEEAAHQLPNLHPVATGLRNRAKTLRQKATDEDF